VVYGQSGAFGAAARDSGISLVVSPYDEQSRRASTSDRQPQRETWLPNRR
jgi:hypothetical protein